MRNMLKIIALIAILLIFYLHSKNLYEGLDTSLRGGNYSDPNWREKRLAVPPLVPMGVIGGVQYFADGSSGGVVTREEGRSGMEEGMSGANLEEGFVSEGGRSCENWRMLRFDVPPLVPGVDVNVAEVQQEIGEYEGHGEDLEEGFVSNYFSQKMEQFREKFGFDNGSSGNSGSANLPKKEEKEAVEGLKEEMDNALKGEPSQKSVQESFNKVVPAINPVPQKELNVEEVIKGNQKNGFKMGLIRPDGSDPNNYGFFSEQCPTGWTNMKAHFTISGNGIHLNCGISKNTKADAFTTINNGKISGVHIKHGGKYSAPPKVLIKSIDGKGNGARGKAILNKNGNVIRVELSNKGKGYESPPEITFKPTKKTCYLCSKPKIVQK